ncbi:MAG: ribose 5-phosphate isomerase B [Fibrobacterota bacterium]
MAGNKIIIGSDHAGFLLKEQLREKLSREGFSITDAGTHATHSVDYPVYAKKVALAVQQGEYARGILVCGTGLGMCYTANRFKGVRAALCTSVEMARLAASHNNANILCLGGRIVSENLAFDIVQAWLSTAFEGGRHQHRINLIDE